MKIGDPHEVVASFVHDGAAYEMREYRTNPDEDPAAGLFRLMPDEHPSSGLLVGYDEVLTVLRGVVDVVVRAEGELREAMVQLAE